MKFEQLLLVALTSVAVLLQTTGCHSRPEAPTISFTLVPVADPGGPESMENIQGTGRNGRSQDRVLLYSYSAGSWWVQPFATRQPYTQLTARSGAGRIRFISVSNMQHSWWILRTNLRRSLRHCRLGDTVFSRQPRHQALRRKQ